MVSIAVGGGGKAFETSHFGLVGGNQQLREDELNEIVEKSQQKSIALLVGRRLQLSRIII
jgi:hypothetical protein